MKSRILRMPLDRPIKLCLLVYSPFSSSYIGGRITSVALHSVALHSVVLHSDSGSSLLHGTRESEELLQDYSCLWIMNCIRTVVRRFQRFHQPDLPSPDTDLISRLTYAAAHTIFHTKNSRAKSNLPNGSAPDDRPISTFFVFVRQ